MVEYISISMSMHQVRKTWERGVGGGDTNKAATAATASDETGIGRVKALLKDVELAHQLVQRGADQGHRIQ